MTWGKNGKTFRRTVKMVLNKAQYQAWKTIGSPEVKKILEHIYESRLTNTQEIIRTWKEKHEQSQ